VTEIPDPGPTAVVRLRRPQRRPMPLAALTNVTCYRLAIKRGDLSLVKVPANLRDLPRGSRLYSRQTEAYCRESYEVPLRRSDLKMHAIYLAILGHLPWWARALIVVRNFIVSFLGLHTQPAADVWKPEVKDYYIPGDRIVRFNLYTLDDNEIVAGGDDKHLDFRVSVMRVTENETHKVVVSTLIFTHNLFGKIYLLFVLPIHRFGMRRLLAQAVALGRI